MTNGISFKTTKMQIKLNKPAFRDSVLKGKGVTNACVKAARNGAAGTKGITVLPQTRGRNRNGATMMCPEKDEHRDGKLTAALGRVHT